MIDWPALLTNHSIDWSQANRRNIYVHCPWCGEADAGQHLGISTEGKGWGCWRNTNHRGKSPVKLLATLLNISFDHAAHILHQEAGVRLVDDKSLSGQLKTLFGEGEELEAKLVKKLRFPKHIVPLTDKRSHRMFIDYLVERGYTKPQVMELCKKHELHCTLEGFFAYRVIFPIYAASGLVTWTGRSIVPGRHPRYLTLPVASTQPQGGDNTSEGKAPPLHAVGPITDYLFQEDELLKERGKALIVGEGPFDAVRMDYVGQPHGIRSTCLFGKAVTSTQLEKLEAIGKQYDERYLVLDPDAQLDEFSMWSRVSRLRYQLVRLPGHWEDPGATPLKALEKFLVQLGRHAPYRAGG